MDEPENKAYRIFLKYLTDPDFSSAWFAKHRQHLEIRASGLINGDYHHHVRVKLEGKFHSFYGMPSNVTLPGDDCGEETIIVQCFTENPKWSWDKQVEPQCTFHRKDDLWTRKI